MKKILFLIFALLLTTSVFAQEETLFGNGEIENGGFGGPVVKFSSVKDEFALFVGGRGGWIINHTITLGGGGYGLVTETDMGLNEFGEKTRLMMGYGGFEIGWILSSNKAIHAEANLLIGAGGLEVGISDRDDWWDDHNGYTDVFFITEPAVNIEMNITDFLRINLGGSYRIVSGVESFGLKNSDIAGPSGNITLKFGKF